MCRRKAIKRVNAPPPGLRSIFIVALENGLRLPIHPYMRDVLSMVGNCPAQLAPNMCISITGLSSAYLLIGVTPTAEFFLTSFSQRTEKDDFLYFVVKPEMKFFYEAFLSKVDPETWRPYFFFVSGEVLPTGVSSGFTSHPKSKAGLSPGSNVDLGALEALMATFNVHDHAPPPLPAAPATSSDQQSLSQTRGGEQFFRGRRVMGPLLRRYFPFPGFPPFLTPLSPLFSLGLRILGPITPSERHMWWAPVMLLGSLVASGKGPPKVRGETYLRLPFLLPGKAKVLCPQLTQRLLPLLSWPVSPSPSPPVLALKAARLSPSPSRELPSSNKRVGSFPANPRPAQYQRMSDKAPLLQSPTFPTQESLASKRSRADPSHEEWISSFFTLGDKALKKEKAHGEGILQRHLRNLSGEHNTLQERYATSVCRTKAVRAELEGMQAERDAAQLERDALRKERESLRADRDEMFGPQLRRMTRTTLPAYLALERTIQVVQAKLEEADLEVPADFWDSVRDDISPLDPFDL
ncbi:hypothetical protein LIER_14318 [Lithospermum erythrorhizon]|uniref:Uncharacterized protein n=1 Tax=Lithospermum erythrorhizon TaxID=34254 RepID=A0AAV3Q202_LITER